MKLKLYTKLGLICNYQHLQKYFYNCNIYKTNSRVTSSGNATGQGIFEKFRAAFDIGQKGHFLEKRAPNILPFLPPLSSIFNPFSKCFASK